MECHEGAKMIKTFRGLIADGAQDTIVLHTNDGKTGYRIVKFQLFPNTFALTEEYTLTIYKVSQAASSATVDFSDQTLLAAGYIETVIAATSKATQPGDVVVFDGEIFNQDIFVNAKSANGNSCNYYLELEQLPLDLNESTVATLQSIRNA